MEGIASLFLILIFVLFYFLVIRRGQRQQQPGPRRATVDHGGQQVMTTAGLYATVSALEDDTVVEIAPGVNVRYARAAVARVIEPVPDIESIPEATTPEPAPDTTPDTRPDRP